MKRHTDLALRKPESTSLSRSMAFNKTQVDDFFKKYISVLEKHKFTAERIWNLDETGITTVMRPVKIVSTKGKKQVGQIASAERGALVTYVGIISAIGTSLPPIFVYPRIRNPSEYLSERFPTGSIALGNKSGWMTSELFPEVLKHIVKHTHCSTDNKILLVLDNHESHISVEAIRYCKSSGIVLLSFPPHTTHRLQPLDVGVYAPFKAHLATSFNDWLLGHPGQAITIRNIGHLSNNAYENAFSLKNIKNAFKKTGLWPPNRLVFTDSDFAASSVTDNSPMAVEGHESNYDLGAPKFSSKANQNSLSTNVNLSDCQESEILTQSENYFNFDPPSISGKNTNEKSCTSLSLEELHPYPKVNATKKRSRKRKSKSTIYTDTPELLIRENIELEKKRKQGVKKNKVVKKDLFAKTSKPEEPTKIKKSNKESSSSDSDVSLDEVYSRSSDDLEQFETVSNGEFEIGDFLLVKFPTKSLVIHYVGRVEKVKSTLLTIKFMRRKGCGQIFLFPNVEDVSEVDSSDVVAKLHTPLQTGTARTASIFTFNYDFSSLNVK